MTNKKPEGGTATQDPPLPAYDEGHVESVHEGRAQGRDDEPRTGQAPHAKDTREQDPKLSDRPDPFMSSEVAKEAAPDPKQTS
jgi:hypothetical protein